MPFDGFAWNFFGIFLIFLGGSVGQIIYTEYTVFRDSNISRSMATGDATLLHYEASRSAHHRLTGSGIVCLLRVIAVVSCSTTGTVVTVMSRLSFWYLFLHLLFMETGLMTRFVHLTIVFWLWQVVILGQPYCCPSRAAQHASQLSCVS